MDAFRYRTGQQSNTRDFHVRNVFLNHYRRRNLYRAINAGNALHDNEEMNPRRRSTHVDVRPYQPADAAPTLAVFLSAVTITASADYSPQQIAAWARADEREVPAWDQSMSARNSFVAVVDGEIAGFSDVSSDGYIDMLFVSPQHSRQGVASALLDFIEVIARERACPSLSANVSVTARPLFENQGFCVETEQHPVLNGVQLNNFRMAKSLGDERHHPRQQVGAKREEGAR